MHPLKPPVDRTGTSRGRCGASPGAMQYIRMFYGADAKTLEAL
jgi:hypothetical protein